MKPFKFKDLKGFLIGIIMNPSEAKEPLLSG